MFHTSCIHSRSFHYWCFLFIWRFKEDFVEKFEPHSEHTIPAPLVSCFIRQCLLKLVLSWYELSHNLHWNKPSELRLNSSLVKHTFDIKCLFNFCLSLNVSLQILHCIFPSIFLSKSCASLKFMLWRPWILCLCWYRLVFELKVELHLSQVISGSSPVFFFMCRFRSFKWEYSCWQTVQVSFSLLECIALWCNTSDLCILKTFPHNSQITSDCFEEW